MSSANVTIGYNSAKAQELVKAITDTHPKIAESMTSGWKTLSQTMQTQWVGADESNAEATLATHMCDLFASCATAINGTVDGIAELNTDWVNFTNQNKISGTSGSASMNDHVFQATHVEEGSALISGTVKDPALTFSADQKIGLASESSGTEIGTALQSYVDTVGQEIQSLYSAIDSTQAFFGQQQEEKMAAYIQKVGEALKKVIAYVEEIKTKLGEMAAKVATTATEASTAMDTAANNINVTAGASNIGQGPSAIQY